MNNRLSFNRLIIILLVVSGFMQFSNTGAQVNVGLDHWFNRETNPKTKQPFHYLWNDTAFSGYSRWGQIFTKNKAKLYTLDRPDAAHLGKMNIYILVDPDTTTENPTPNYIEQGDIKTMETWVKRGGVLVLLANDAPNCEFTHLNNLASKFGIVFNHVSLHTVTGQNWDMGAFTSLPDHPIFKGVKKIYLKEISSLSISGDARPVLQENGIVYMAESQVGKGWVFAVGDPWIYNEYIDHDRLPESFDNRTAAENLTKYLLSHVRKK